MKKTNKSSGASTFTWAAFAVVTFFVGAALFLPAYFANTATPTIIHQTLSNLCWYIGSAGMIGLVGQLVPLSTVVKAAVEAIWKKQPKDDDPPPS